MSGILISTELLQAQVPVQVFHYTRTNCLRVVDGAGPGVGGGGNGGSGVAGNVTGNAGVGLHLGSGVGRHLDCRRTEMTSVTEEIPAKLSRHSGSLPGPSQYLETVGVTSLKRDSIRRMSANICQRTTCQHPVYVGSTSPCPKYSSIPNLPAAQCQVSRLRRPTGILPLVSCLSGHRFGHTRQRAGTNVCRQHRTEDLAARSSGLKYGISGY